MQMMNLFFVVIGFIIGVCVCGVISDCKHIDEGNRDLTHRSRSFDLLFSVENITNRIQNR